MRQLAVDSEGSAGRFHAVDGQDTADPATGGGAVDAATTSGQPSPAEKSDAWLIGRARELLALIQVSSADDQRAIVREMTALLAESQRRGDPRTTGQLLRYSAICHMLTPGQLATADSMLDELLALSRRHGLLVQMADTHALRASVTLLSGVDD
ncbi:MAG: hypothetical protein J2O49_03910, partial [Sciscionella sp.]|nr:hypothetical protein [Sciscionella sp.]